MQTIVGMFLGLLILVVGTQIFVSGQENKIYGTESSALVGVWRITATLRNCTTGDPLGTPFQALYSYHLGGTLTVNTSNPPTLQITHHGIWEASNQFHPSFAFTFFRFNPDGTFAGTATIRQGVNLGVSGNDYTSSGTFQIIAVNGTVVNMGCVTTTATRFQ